MRVTAVLRQHYQGHAEMNNSSRVVWRVTIEPGESFEPEVVCDFYVRH